MIEKLAKAAGWIKHNEWWIGKHRLIKHPESHLQDAIEAAQSVGICWGLSSRFNSKKCAYAVVHVIQAKDPSMWDRYHAVIYDPPKQYGNFDGDNCYNLAKALSRATARAIRGIEAREKRSKKKWKE